MVGVIPKMRQLMKDAPGVSLALSLHAPNQALREKIVPTATAFKLPALMTAIDEYLASGPGVKLLIEYCVLGGVNDSEECARELGAGAHTRPRFGSTQVLSVGLGVSRGSTEGLL
jgi:adenine C2-methylase RlmN of 23S rRNA A2503 and tRNA A37